MLLAAAVSIPPHVSRTLLPSTPHGQLVAPLDAVFDTLHDRAHAAVYLEDPPGRKPPIPR
eukprot:670747-Pyramimonas_sp.AAC.1